MWQTNPFVEKLGLDRLIIQAPMAGATTPELAAAVSNAGGLGGLGLATSPIEVADAQIAAFRALSNRSLNINFFCHTEPDGTRLEGTEMWERLRPYYAAKGLDSPVPHAPFPTFGSDHLELIRRHRPQVVSFHFGLPPSALFSAVKATGALVLSSATTVAEARWLEAQGVDAVIAQGLEAGGHRGTFLNAAPSVQTGLFALLPQIVRGVRIPVIAAGGIADGRGIAAALMLGASGVQIGTAFLRCPEAAVHPDHRAALATAHDDGTRLTRLFSGRPARVIRNRYTEALKDVDDLAFPFPIQASVSGPLRQGADASDFASFAAGQGAPLTRAMPASDLVHALIGETVEALRQRD